FCRDQTEWREGGAEGTTKLRQWLLEGFPSTADHNHDSWNYRTVALALVFSVEQAQGHEGTRQTGGPGRYGGGVFSLNLVRFRSGSRRRAQSTFDALQGCEFLVFRGIPTGFQRRPGSLHLFQNIRGFGGPQVGLRLLIVLVDIVADGVHQVPDVMKDAAADALHGQIAEESLHDIEPRGAGGDEVEVKSWVAGQPEFYFRGFVGGIVVQNEVELFVLWGPPID